MELKNRTLSNFAELVRTGECKNFKGRLKVGVDLGTANTVLAVVDNTNRPIAGISAPSRAIRDGVIVNFYESVQLVTKLKAELEEKMDEPYKFELHQQLFDRTKEKISECTEILAETEQYDRQKDEYIKERDRCIH